ncbi:MAG: hypothetical protein UX04_C0006G0001 [Microgenomates group bacterium GW2011_GWF2_45_18]|nr:MAG: hypothetical protein UW18_C0006G0001 [Microgenomates group bacterium GW2011_GWF1_44_10]KKU01466.1 MAG: hypothetical protein UX04_C0006G0001 [Microgenomates group bacterium GW2011_GWF2_45_18]OGJ40599.1 MAG: hypothetical protein A2378_01965 [Candidatus Pacebacteria bacterium RIFOXYB1_FULL_44_10]HAU99377.1 hypothetical protein [Candidatus Paceibacterota bacterium]HAX01619.1 hypothetical protein [Candidatus Paceibacterota bacterium]
MSNALQQTTMSSPWPTVGQDKGPERGADIVRALEAQKSIEQGSSPVRALHRRPESFIFSSTRQEEMKRIQDIKQKLAELDVTSKKYVASSFPTILASRAEVLRPTQKTGVGIVARIDGLIKGVFAIARYKAKESNSWIDVNTKRRYKPIGMSAAGGVSKDVTETGAQSFASAG